MKFKPIYLLYLILLIPFLFRLWGGNPDTLEWENLQVNNLNGQSVNLSQYKGKKLVMNFWATWCGPCLAEMPSMEEARRQLEAEDYVFVLISDEPIEKIRAFKASKPDYGFEFLQLRQSINSQGIHSIPQTYIINREGDIVDDISGMIDWTGAVRIESLKAVE